jgi:hypothetical protein
MAVQEIPYPNISPGAATSPPGGSAAGSRLANPSRLSRRARRGALALLGGLAPAVLLVTSPMRAEANTVSTLTGQVLITAGLTGSTVTNTPASPIPTMTLRFRDMQPNDIVSGTLETFGIPPVSTTIVGVDPFNFWYMDVCMDNQTVSGFAGSGQFDRATGALTGLSLDIRVQHSLVPGPGSGPLAPWGCPNTHIPDDHVTVDLSTASPGGAALDQTGQIRLNGTGTVSAGERSGLPVTVTVAGVLSPLPDRSPQTCVLVPDVADDSRAQADSAIRAVGLNPAFNKDPGNGSYVTLQFPQADECVAPGSTVRLTLHAGPRP